MKCAVIILNWNGEKMLRQFLPSVVKYSLDESLKSEVQSLKSQEESATTHDSRDEAMHSSLLQTQDLIEVIVADNGSTDASLKILKEEFPTVRVLDLKHNYGFAEGYNRAIQAIEAEYVVLLNSDVEVTEGWLNPILSYMDDNHDVVACQPKILKALLIPPHRGEVPSESKGAEHRTQDTEVLKFGNSEVMAEDATEVRKSVSGDEIDSPPRVRGFEHAGAAGGFMDTLGYPYCRGRIMDYVAEDKGQYDNTIDVFWASGACLFIRREAYLSNGGLDADFFAHMEEIDLCWRLNARGYRLACVPQSAVYHLGGGSLPYNNPRKTFLNFRNNLLMIYKNMPGCQMVKVMIARFFMDYAAAMMYLLKGDGQNFLSVIRARMAFWQLRRSFAPKRKANLSATTVPHPNTIIHRSIIWDYYVRGLRE